MLEIVSQTFTIFPEQTAPIMLVCTVDMPAQHLPSDPTNKALQEVGIVFVTGGNQIRAGSHRQFLKLARSFAGAGHPCLRFDLPGLGDSAGECQPFLHNESSLRAAIDALCLRMPSVKRVVLWGLCDGATAAALYAETDIRVSGLILVNPWVRSEQLQAQVLIGSYYRQRFSSLAFWHKLLSGRVGVWRSAKTWIQNYSKARAIPSAGGIAERVMAVLGRWGGSLEIIIAGQDLTGKEFLEAVNRHALVLPVSIVADADHTFSVREWHQALQDLSLKALIS